MNKEINCFICDQKNEICADEEDLCDISMLERDIKDHVKTFFNSNEHSQIDQCGHIDELWLIQNRTGIANPSTEKLCTKHRNEYGTMFKSKNRQTCKFPLHSTKGKRKQHSGERTIPLNVLTELQKVSAVVLPIGSVWCNNCRMHRYQSSFTDEMKESMCICGKEEEPDTCEVNNCNLLVFFINFERQKPI